MNKFLLTLPAFLLFCLSIKAQDSIVLVQSYNSYFYPNDHMSMAVINNKLVHAGQNSNFGNNLWQTDGTPIGTTTLLATTNPILGYMPTAIVSALGKIFFVSSLNTNKYLYSSDGTLAGTFKLCKLGSTTTFQYPEDFLNSAKVANGKLFFIADSSATGKELWATDGTLSGTGMVKDILPGSFGSVGSAYSTVLNNKIYFVADNGVNGNELWVSDGTSANTKMVYDLHSGGNSSTYFQSNLITFNNEIYFMATVGGFQYGLYKTDGSVGVMPALLSNSLTLTTAPIVYNNSIYFGATTYTSTIYSSSGDLYNLVSNAPNLVADVTYSDAIAGNVQGVNYLLGSTTGHLFLNVNSSNYGDELWAHSVTTNTVSFLKDIATGTLSGLQSSNFIYDVAYNNKKISLGNKMVFVAKSYSNGITSGNGSHQEEVWVSDGTVSGTLRAHTTNTLYVYQNYYHNTMSIYNGDVYFYGGYYSSPTLCRLKLGINGVGIEENSKQSLNFLIYPNPTSEFLNIETDKSSFSKGSIIITNIAGEIIYTGEIHDLKTIVNIEHFKSGMYFLMLENNGVKSTKKFIIE